ncbi:MAG TPA: endolytic transglycosylase MltG, partial [Fibrobacteria bacterium]|nr:endolytic transglycosylase MltG [Fibrobacteria bacterium]
MEGYLFPDTYLFDGSESPMDIARALHKRFRKVIQEAGDTATSPVWKTYGLHGVATLASIVEREAAVRTEAPRIAGVFWLRLQQDIPLGADPTVRYALGKFTGSLTKSDLAFDSPYNTRLYAGLIPGPIANAGKDALRAAMFPDDAGGWLYFVAKDDGSREHFFAKDLNQHVRYKDQAARNRRISGVMAP